MPASLPRSCFCPVLVFYPCDTRMKWSDFPPHTLCTHLNTKIVSKEAYLMNKCRVIIQIPQFLLYLLS